MNVINTIDEIEDLLTDLRKNYETEVGDMQNEFKTHEQMIEEMSETISTLQDENGDLLLENKYLESKVIQLEMELIEAITKQKVS